MTRLGRGEAVFTSRVPACMLGHTGRRWVFLNVDGCVALRCSELWGSSSKRMADEKPLRNLGSLPVLESLAVFFASAAEFRKVT